MASMGHFETRLITTDMWWSWQRDGRTVEEKKNIAQLAQISIQGSRIRTMRASKTTRADQDRPHLALLYHVVHVYLVEIA